MSQIDESNKHLDWSLMKTIIDGVAILGPGWKRLYSLLGLYVLTTIFEGFGIGMMLPVAELLQKGGEVTAGMRAEGYWRYLNIATDWLGVPLHLSTLLLASLAFFMIRNIFMYTRTIALTNGVQEFIRNNRVKGFELFLRSSSGYQDRMSAGRIINDLTVQLATSGGAIFSIVVLTHIAFMALYYFAFLLVLSWKLTLSVLVVLVIVAFVVRPIARRSKIVGDQLVSVNQSASAFLAERIGAARLIRLAQMEAAEVAEMFKKSNKQAVREVILVRNSTRTSIIVETFVMLCGMALLYFGGSVLGLELVTIGMTLAILLRQLPVAREFIITRHAIISNLPALARTAALFREMQKAAEPDDGVLNVVKLRRGITLRDVVFRYTPDRDPALRGITLTFLAGKMTALVGPSGGGKSTLIDLLPRLRDPDEGTIQVDDTPIADFTRSALRKMITYTPQTPQIFNLTVAQHIRYGKLDATDTEVREAARLAGADAFIESWSEGYETLLGERGVKLSGGQRQRIDLARALISGADILVLDEPTSNVDAETEHNFQKTLQQLREETTRTIIVVGHRLSTVREADQIVVINEGRVSETGTHQELIARNGWYAGAFRLQARGLTDAEMEARSA